MERGWGGFVAATRAGRSIGYTYGTDYMKYFVFGDPQWDYRTWDYGRDLAQVDADQRNRSVMDTWNPDLRRFRRGGKLILYHGWGDDAVQRR